MKCPKCGHGDLRDQGWIRGVHVMVCRKCKALISEESKLRLLKPRNAKDAEVMKSLL